MRILIVGADGMIGYGLWAYFHHLSGREVVGSIRTKRDLASFGTDWRSKVIVTGDIECDSTLEMLFSNAEPSLVINCAGATMHAEGGQDHLVALPANSILPHRLHKFARRHGARFIHLSTDCVYDGARGGYAENEPPNAKTVYGLSKALGEVTEAHDALTIRTSPIGYEVSSRRGLLAWFLEQRGTIKGFTNAYFTGLTNLQLAKIIDGVFADRPELHGLYHVTGPRISKFDLLVKCREAFEQSVEIDPDGALVLDRSLDGSRLTAETGYTSPGWDQMLAELADFARLYPAATVTRGSAS